MKKKRKGCRNCIHGGVIRFGKHKFPVIHCYLNTDDSSIWDGINDFDAICDKHEWRKKEGEQ
jgi:hypothetical protein